MSSSFPSHVITRPWLIRQIKDINMYKLCSRAYYGEWCTIMPEQCYKLLIPNRGNAAITVSLSDMFAVFSFVSPVRCMKLVSSVLHCVTTASAIPWLWYFRAINKQSTYKMAMISWNWNQFAISGLIRYKHKRKI